MSEVIYAPDWQVRAKAEAEKRDLREEMNRAKLDNEDNTALASQILRILGLRVSPDRGRIELDGWEFRRGWTSFGSGRSGLCMSRPLPCGHNLHNSQIENLEQVGDMLNSWEACQGSAECNICVSENIKYPPKVTTAEGDLIRIIREIAKGSGE